MLIPIFSPDKYCTLTEHKTTAETDAHTRFVLCGYINPVSPSVLRISQFICGIPIYIYICNMALWNKCMGCVNGATKEIKRRKNRLTHNWTWRIEFNYRSRFESSIVFITLTRRMEFDKGWAARSPMNYSQRANGWARTMIWPLTEYKSQTLPLTSQVVLPT